MPMTQANLIASTLDRIISALLTNPGILLADFDCFSRRNRDQILKWNSNSLDRVERCIHEVIYDQVCRRPDAQAVCAWDGNFTFRELDAAADKLAEQLIQLGVGPEVRVPLCFDKSVSTTIRNSHARRSN
jgi:non-ribosomal peptide synthetase component F